MLWDPFGLFAELLRNAYQQVVILFEWMIANPPSLGQNPLVAFLNGNALGAAPFLAVSVVAVTMVLALFWGRGRMAFARALIVFLAVATLSPFWYQVTAALENVGDDLTRVAMTLVEQSTGGGPNIPMFPQMTFTDAFWAVMTFGPAAFFGYLLFGTFLVYEFVTVVVAFLGLLSLSLLAIGPRSRKAFNFLVATGLVTMVLGRPVAMICIELGQAFAGLFAGTPNAVFVQGAATVGSLFLALLAQPILLVLMYQGVSRVGGLVDARITGTVKSITEGRTTLSGRTAVDANIASMSGRREALERTAGQSLVGGIAQAGIAAGAAKGAAALAARAAASTTPVGAAVATGASIVVSQLPKVSNSVKKRRA
jgi:hypothetical protein